jgi:tRNA A37 threonylcarbamoyladenosine dehydratase
VGTPKVKCIEKSLKQIAKWVEVDSRIEIWRKEEGGDLLEDADWVIGRLQAKFLRPLLIFQKMPLTTYRQK